MTLTRLLSPLTSLVIFILGHDMFNTLLAGYLVWRRRQRAPIPLAEHQVFMPVPSNTPMTAELERRTDLEGEAVPATYAAPEVEEVEDVEGMEAP